MVLSLRRRIPGLRGDFSPAATSTLARLRGIGLFIIEDGVLCYNTDGVS